MIELSGNEKQILESLATSGPAAPENIVTNIGNSIELTQVEKILDELIKKELVGLSTTSGQEIGLTQIGKKVAIVVPEQKSNGTYYLTPLGRNMTQELETTSSGFSKAVAVCVVLILGVLIFLYLKK